MKVRQYVLLLVLLSATALPINAQRGNGGGGGDGSNNNNNNNNGTGGFGDQLVITAGGMLEVYPFSSRPIVSPITFEETFATMYTFGAMAYYPLAHNEDWVSVGIEAGLNVGFRFNTAIGTDFIAQFPVFAAARVGAGSTAYNSQTLGFGVGVGLQPSYVRMGFVGSLDLGNGTYSDFTARLNNFVPAPSAMVEITFLAYVLRIHASLMRSDVNMDFDSGTFTIPEREIPIRVGNYGLGLLYRF